MVSRHMERNLFLFAYPRLAFAGLLEGQETQKTEHNFKLTHYRIFPLPRFALSVWYILYPTNSRGHSTDWTAVSLLRDPFVYGPALPFRILKALLKSLTQRAQSQLDIVSAA
jgi:hypothetical protein